MPLKLKFIGGDSRKAKVSQPNASPTRPSPNHAPGPGPADHGRYNPSSKSQRQHSTGSNCESSSTSDGDYSPVFSDGGNNNYSPATSPQSAPEQWTSPPRYDQPQKRRPKSVSEPVHPEDLSGVSRGKESSPNKPGRNRAFSVSRSGKLKETKRRTSLLEIQDRFDKAAKDQEDATTGERLGSVTAQE